MGNTQPTTSEEGDDPFDGIDTLGYRVLGVQPDSPASQAGLVSFLDFLLGANERMLLGSGEGLQDGDEYDDVDLPGLLAENKGKPVEFLVYNIKSQSSRLVSLTPRDDWGGAGLLGVTIRLDNYAGAQERLIRVLSVEPKSPAAIAGLVPLKDFLLGTSHQTLDSTATLAALLRQNQDAVMELYVYNCDSDVVRVVALLPTRQWEGVGLLGAEVGMGYLHRLPSSVRHTEGTSVERKVRYVGVKPNEPRPTKPVLMVELEPQLEMEPAPHEEDEDVSTRDLLSVQLSEDANDDSGQMNADLAPKMPERLTSDDANQLDKQQKETFDNGSKGHTETPILDDQTEIREKPPASHAQHTEQVVPFLPPPPNKPSDSGARRPSLEPVHRSAAEDVFGKPPPPAANTFFPPPPKMHFESPPPKDV